MKGNIIELMMLCDRLLDGQVMAHELFNSALVKSSMINLLRW